MKRQAECICDKLCAHPCAPRLQLVFHEQASFGRIQEALREMGHVMRELGVELKAFYASNVEYYLWRSRSLDRWRTNLQGMPVASDAVVIRSYFANFGGGHPSAVSGYYATQTLQHTPVAGGRHRVTPLVRAQSAHAWSLAGKHPGVRICDNRTVGN